MYSYKNHHENSNCVPHTHTQLRAMKIEAEMPEEKLRRNEPRHTHTRARALNTVEVIYPLHPVWHKKKIFRRNHSEIRERERDGERDTYFGFKKKKKKPRTPSY